MRKKDDKIEITVEEAGDDALQARLAELEDQLAAARAAADEYREDLLRRAADLDNARKRLERDYERACAYASQGVIEKLLPILADLTRTIDAADADDAVPQHYVDAVRMLDRKIYDVLRQEGLEPVPAARGDVFNPEVHDAVMTTCEPDLPPGTVAAVLEPGFTFRGVLLRPARVQVCVEAPPPGAETDR